MRMLDPRRRILAMTVYRLLLVFKFVGVCAYAGGLVASFVATTHADRKRAVHSIASPGLLATWVAGYLLTTQVNVTMTELWILGGLVLSLASQIALIRSLKSATRTVSAFAAAAVPLILVLALMVFRPTWGSLRS